MYYPSPVGKLLLVTSDVGLRAVLWEAETPDRVRINDQIAHKNHPILDQTAKELSDYFEKKRRVFTVPLDAQGTEFQKQVWQALRDIPYGETRSYGEQAKSIGKPKAVRAVGAANGRNPISIIVPCHRVIGRSGHLIGFGGGLPAKKMLLRLEGGLL